MEDGFRQTKTSRVVRLRAWNFELVPLKRSVLELMTRKSSIPNVLLLFWWHWSFISWSISTTLLKMHSWQALPVLKGKTRPSGQMPVHKLLCLLMCVIYVLAESSSSYQADFPKILLYKF